MSAEFKKVPAVDKCFTILELFARSPHPLGVSDVSSRLGLNKSTVFNIVRTLAGWDVLEKNADGKFRFGPRLYMLGIAAGRSSGLIQIVHPFLEEINSRTKLSAFLGMRSGSRAIIVDKVDTAHDMKISSEVGMRLPLLAGAGGKALLSLLADDEIDRPLDENTLEKFTPRTRIDKATYKKEVLNVRETGIAVDREEYIEGVVAFAAPLKSRREKLHAAIWAVGLKRQCPEKSIPGIERYLKDIAMEINNRFYLNGGPAFDEGKDSR